MPPTPSDDEQASAPPASIARQADAVLRKSARERLELLLHAPQPMRLVRALPDGELYLTVREVGPHDALPLMALASASQIKHLIDLEAWRKDRFDAERAGAWVAFLLEAGEPTAIRFLRNADDELLVLLMSEWMHVRQIDIDDTPSPHGHGETEAGTESGFLSPDGWHRFAPTIHEHAPAMRRIAELLLESDAARYERLMRDARLQLSSELEEQALQWRNSRMEEHGFPPPDEAMDIFAAPAGIRGHAAIPLPEREGDLASPRAVVRVEAARRLLAPAVDLLDTELRERVLFETAAAANRILVAERADTGDPAAHRGAALSVAGFVEIALARRGARHAEAAASVLADVPVIELFREGLAGAVELRERAREQVRNSWPAAYPHALEILDAPLRGALSGILLRRPVYFDTSAQREEDAFREFRSLEEIDQTAAALELIEVVGRAVFDALGWTMDQILALKTHDEVLPKASWLLATSLVFFTHGETLEAGAVSASARAAFLEKFAAQSAPLLEEFARRLAAQIDASERQSGLLLAFLRALAPSIDSRIIVRGNAG